ncbi:hypothetical protein J7S33_03500, partial [Saccharothrix algeriensis]
MDTDAVENLGGRITGRGEQLRTGVAAKLNISAGSSSAGVFGQVAMIQADRAIATARNGADKAAEAADNAGAKTKATAQTARDTDQSAANSLRRIESRPPVTTSTGSTGTGTSSSPSSSSAGRTSAAPTLPGGPAGTS